VTPPDSFDFPQLFFIFWLIMRSSRHEYFCVSSSSFDNSHFRMIELIENMENVLKPKLPIRAEGVLLRNATAAAILPVPKRRAVHAQSLRSDKI
jgi:hypothetical protein